MKLFDGSVELCEMCSWADEHAEVKDSIGVGEVGELWDVFGDVSLYHCFSFLCDGEYLCFIRVET